jgi:surfeit locus 1 family protein
VMVQQVYGKADSKPIWRRYALGTLDGSGEDVLVMVGATVGANPIPQAVSKLSEMITIEGNLLERTATKGLFGVEDEPEKNTWFTMDPQAIAAALGSEVAAIRVVEPVTLTLLNSGTQGQFSQMPNPYAFAKPLDPLPPERHFGYALTWWGMAIGLLGVYLALHHSKGRLRFRKA